MGFLDPFAVDGATITASQLRQHLFQTVKGETGVLGPEHLKAVAVPGQPGVLGLLPGVGAVSVESRSESYQLSNTAMDGDALVDVPPAGSGGATWHAIVEITDPQFHGQDPEVTLKVVPSVAGITKPYLYVASFSLPEGGSLDVTTPITDRRRVINPRTRRAVASATVPAGPNTVFNTTSFQDWGPPVNVDVPEWATRAVVMVRTVGGHQAPDVNGELRVRLGAQDVAVMPYNLDLDDGSVRTVLDVAGNATIGVSAGGTRSVQLAARRTAGTGYIHTLAGSHIIYDVEFIEAPA